MWLSGNIIVGLAPGLTPTHFDLYLLVTLVFRPACGQHVSSWPSFAVPTVTATRDVATHPCQLLYICGLPTVPSFALAGWRYYACSGPAPLPVSRSLWTWLISPAVSALHHTALAHYFSPLPPLCSFFTPGCCPCWKYFPKTHIPPPFFCSVLFICALCCCSLSAWYQPAPGRSSWTPSRGSWVPSLPPVLWVVLPIDTMLTVSPKKEVGCLVFWVTAASIHPKMYLFSFCFLPVCDSGCWHPEPCYHLNKLDLTLIFKIVKSKLENVYLNAKFSSKVIDY